MKIAYFIAAALLVFGQSAQGAEDDTLPSEACLTSAKKVATKLQAAADLVAGQQGVLSPNPRNFRLPNFHTRG